MEDEYAEVFGVTADEETPAAGAGANEQGTAAPASETGAGVPGGTQRSGSVGERRDKGAGGGIAAGGSDQSGLWPDDAAPASEEGQQDPAAAAEPVTGGPGDQQPNDGGAQSPEERHQQAEARRQQEAEAMRAAEQARVDKVYADMFTGQTNPFTGQPIRGEADYLAYQQALQAQQAATARQRMEQQLQEAGVAPDILRQMVDQQVQSHPVVQQAQQAALAMAHERAVLVQQQATASIAKSLEVIAVDFPEVKTLEDIGKFPTAGRFQELVNQGVPLEDAFFLANRQEYAKRQREASRQAAINGARGIWARVSAMPPARRPWTCRRIWRRPIGT